MKQNTKRYYGVWKILGRGYFEIAAMNKFKKNLQGVKRIFTTRKCARKNEKKGALHNNCKIFFRPVM